MAKIKQAYQQLLDKNELRFDKAQLTAVDALAQLASALTNQPASTDKTSLFDKALGTHRLGIEKHQHTQGSHQLLQGLYFYGRVGRGKTMLMDLFYHNVAIEHKKRIHFHHFMESVHQQLKQLTGTPEPLDVIAMHWAQEVKLLCFDEFFVSDIADAMLLAGLLSALFTRGVILVATSNCQPEQLYRNGLQRERFLPTIALINQYCQILSIDGDVDHRRKHFIPMQSYKSYFLIAGGGNEKLKHKFLSLTEHSSLSQVLEPLTDVKKTKRLRPEVLLILTTVK